MTHISIRRLVYKFMELPWVVKREIAHDLRVILYSEEFADDQAFCAEFFIRLKRMDLAETLKKRLFPDYSLIPETHPCD